jgi:cytochrome P450
MPQLDFSMEWPVNPNSLINPDFHATGNPQLLWSWMRSNTPIYWHEPSHLPGFWSVTRYEDIRTIYSNPKVFSSARGVLLRPAKYGDDPGGGLTLALTDPPRHKQLRTIMAGWFSISYARSLEDIIRAKIRDLLSQATYRGRCNFSNDIAARLTLFVTCHILGIEQSHHDNVFDWAHESFEEGKPLAAHQDFMLYFCELMERKKINPGNDLASAIVHGFIDDIPLAEKEIILNFENLIGATENAGLSIASGILAFLEHPESWMLLDKNRDLIVPATEEILRWASSASHSMRVVTESIEINGEKFEEGDCVALWLPSANRDEEIFTDPFRFDITRVPNRHMALGYGEHFCIGNALARVQMRTLLNELLNLEYKLELEGTPKRLSSIHVNGPEILPICFKKK